MIRGNDQHSTRGVIGKGRPGQAPPQSVPSKASDFRYMVALAGNPNTGKSTVFNSLAGLKQHTGNWSGKTVTLAKGFYRWREAICEVIDLPGTYSLAASSQDEEVASDFIQSGQADAVVVVVDATCLERNLNLALQIMATTPKVVICLNLMDEAEKRGFRIDVVALEKELGVPVVPCVARKGKGMEKLKDAVFHVAAGRLEPHPIQAAFEDDQSMGSLLDSQEADSRRIDTKEPIITRFYHIAHDICRRVVETADDNNRAAWYERIDDVLTSRTFGIPIMILLLGVVFWITLWGANVPSQMLAKILFRFQDSLGRAMTRLGTPPFLHGILVLGAYRTCAWVVSVMLPPMAIFFPMFTLLEDLGYLPRVAFNLDHLFKKAGAHGKQALTMSMGLGCNAVGVVACRIIESPREKIIALLTNVFMPCNGRFPTILTLSSIFLAGVGLFPQGRLASALAVLTLVLIGFVITLLVSRILTSTVLSGVPSAFILEMPSFRPPQVWSVLVRSVLDRTLFVLGRAAAMAAPAGAVTWIIANIFFNGESLLAHAAAFFSPIGNILGMDGTCLLAFILGFPANEIVLPVAVMSYSSSGTLLEMGSLEAMREILMANGWTTMTAISFMLFSLLHWPCSTTLWTIKKETQSWKWTFLAAAIPTFVAAVTIIAVRAGMSLLVPVINWAATLNIP